MNELTYDELAVRQLHNEVVKAFNAVDMDKLLSLHTDNIILMDPGMPTIQGKDEVKKLFQKFAGQKISLQLSFTIDEVIIFGNRAFVRGKVYKTLSHNGSKPENETGRFVTLSQKQSDGRWLRTHVMANVDAVDSEIIRVAQSKPMMKIENNIMAS